MEPISFICHIVVKGRLTYIFVQEGFPMSETPWHYYYQQQFDEQEPLDDPEIAQRFGFGGYGRFGRGFGHFGRPFPFYPIFPFYPFYPFFPFW